MATRIRVPGLIDVLRIDDAASMKELNDHPDISRAPIGGGGLINRLIRRRIESEMRAGESLLPVFVARGNDSGQRHRSLAGELEKRDVGSRLQRTALQRLGRYVAGRGSSREAAILIQEVIGRIFVPTFLATERTYAAALVFDRWPRSGPLRALWLRFGGRITQARELLSERAHADPHCLHAIGIAMHNVVKAVEGMRALAASGVDRLGDDADAIVARCLVAPDSAIRWCSASGAFMRRRIRRGTLIQFQLEKMRGAGAGNAATFHVGEWSECPAVGFVPRLLAEIWRESRASIRK